MFQKSVDHLFDRELRTQVEWLGVPMVNAMPHGHFKSAVPKAKLSFGLSAAMNPKLWPLIKRADQAMISAGYNQHTMITNANGEILARPQNEDWQGLLDDFRNYSRAEQCMKTAQLMGSEA